MLADKVGCRSRIDIFAEGDVGAMTEGTRLGVLLTRLHQLGAGIVRRFLITRARETRIREPVFGSSSQWVISPSTRHAIVPFRDPYNLQTDCTRIYRK